MKTIYLDELNNSLLLKYWSVCAVPENGGQSEIVYESRRLVKFCARDYVQSPIEQIGIWVPSINSEQKSKIIDKIKLIKNLS
jgi:hypothetical protein